jgi:acyl-CoA synthetase (AMP-forming)/AMP-acid ligase II
VASDRSLLVMPLFHVHGLMAGLLAPLTAHAAVILPAAGRFAASSFWKDAVQYGATFYTGTAPYTRLGFPSIWGCGV